MSEPTLYFTDFLAFLTLAAHVFIVVMLLAFLFRRAPAANALVTRVGRHAVVLGFVVAAGGVAASLVYSNVIGYPPCELCWIQRIFLYPLAVLFPVALMKRDRGVVDYALALSVIGLGVGVYQIFVQFAGVSFAGCTLAGADCSRIYFQAIGYITIPVMSATSFALLTVLMSAAKLTDDERSLYDKIHAWFKR